MEINKTENDNMEFSEFGSFADSFGFGFENTNSEYNYGDDEYSPVIDLHDKSDEEEEQFKYRMDYMIDSFCDFKKDPEKKENERKTYEDIINLCKLVGISIDENVDLEINSFIDNINKKIEEEYGINLGITTDNYENLIKQAFKYEGNPIIQNQLLSILLNLNITNNNNVAGVPYYINEFFSELYYDSNEKRFDQELNLAVSAMFRAKKNQGNEVFSYFGDSQDLTNNENIKQVVHKLCFIKKLSEIVDIRYKYMYQYLSKIQENQVEIIKMNNPEFYDELCELTKETDEYDLYYHGTCSNDISNKICEEGLYMQYGDINRTAVKGLTPEQIIQYTYGHENVGSRSIVVIKVPKGLYPVEINNDRSVIVSGTGQGLEGANEFHPGYVIPKEYIAGIIDKENYQYIASSTYGKEEGFRR